jgi:hypothetical protein
MKRLFLAATCLAVSATPALAGNSTAVGVGVAKSTSVSGSQATAISGQGGAGGQGGQGGVGIGVGVGGQGGTVSIAGAPSQTAQTVTTQGHSSVSTVPSVFAPGLAAAGIESCLGSVSGGGSWLGTGITLGGSIPDKDCSARLDARTLWSFGLKKAAVARLCQTYDIYASMPEVCGQYVPRPAPAYAPVAVQATYASVDTASLPSGTIMLIEGRTGRERPCSNYDEAHSRCLRWVDAVTPKPKQVTRMASGRETSSAASRPVKKEAAAGAEPHPAVVPIPVPRPAAASHAVSELTPSLQKPLWLQMIHPEEKPRVKTEDEVKNEESISRCIGFCAAGNGWKR